MRIVVKVGTSTLTHTSGRINIRRTEKLCKILSDVKNAGHELILVSSGAIGMGVGKLNMKSKPEDMPTKQAAAAIGQCELMYLYDKLFREYNHIVAQMLITGLDFSNEESHKNFQSTLNRLLELNVIPIINENDTIATQEISVGDNDTMGAIVAENANADLLIILSDIDGLYTGNPHTDPDAVLIHYVDKIDDTILSYAGDAVSGLGTGGMATKLKAAQMVNALGSHMCIVNGQKENSILNALDNEGTWFNGASGTNMNARRHWIAYRTKPRGTIIVDAGCRKAIVDKHVSLLPTGIKDVEGRFLEGQVVDIKDEELNTIAKGVVNYASDEIRLIKGHQSSEIDEILHRHDYDEVVHANNMVVLEER